MNILLVEPDHPVRRTLGLLLRESGHEVYSADSCEALIPILDAHWPDAIVMNYFQGEQTAVQICEQITSLFGEMPATLIHSPAPEHRFYALRFDNAVFLESPFSPEELQLATESLDPTEKSRLTG